MNVVNQEQLDKYRVTNTREIELPDGSRQTVRMTPELWESLDLLEMWEIMSPSELASYAQEEMTLRPGVSFDRALRGVVAHVANLWAKKGQQ